MPFRGNRRSAPGRMFRRGKRWNLFMYHRMINPEETCICPNCMTVVPHQQGVPCFKTKCPKCGAYMARQFLSR
jgi:hypothetical protein